MTKGEESALFGIEALGYDEWKKRAELEPINWALIQKFFRDERAECPPHLLEAFDEICPLGKEPYLKALESKEG